MVDRVHTAVGDTGDTRQHAGQGPRSEIDPVDVDAALAGQQRILAARPDPHSERGEPEDEHECGRQAACRRTKRNSSAPSAPTMPRLISARSAKGRPEPICSRPTISAASSMKLPCAKLKVSVARNTMTMPIA